MNAKHTPTPWETGSLMSRVQVWPAGWPVPMCVADCAAKYAPESNGEQCANAAFIVRACNNFEELVKALERAVDHLIMDLDRNGKGIQSHDTPEALIQARAALAKARGE